MNYESNGLNEKEVNESRKMHGSNALSQTKKTNFFMLLLESLNDPIIKILLIALGIKILFLFKDSNIYETLGILLAILVASLISTISEYGSEKAFEKLTEENSKIKCRVIRNKILKEIDIDEVVVGDIISLSTGDKVPADGKIINSYLYVDESSLTGESKEKYKTINDNVLRGSVVVDNEAKMIVNSVGDKTFYGGIAKSIQEKNPESPLKIRLRGLAKFISKIGYVSAFLVVVSYLFNVIVVQNNFDINKIINLVTNFNLIFPHIVYALTLAVTIIVVAVPEGLPMMITLVLSSNMKRMLKNNVLVRKLVGIETAGSLNILFTDKTGTLTEGKLKVLNFMTGDFNIYNHINNIENDVLKELSFISLVYNNASNISGNKIIGGNTTDRSIIEFVNTSDKSKYNIIDKVSFNSKNKYSKVKLSYNNGIWLIKGASEVLLKKCKWMYDKNGTKTSIKNINEIEKYINNQMKDGVRVLTFCTSLDDNIHNLTLLGFVFIKDKIRSGAYKGIELVNSAGIQTVMITGDAKETAVAIANELKLIQNDSIILTSEELGKMTDEEVKDIIPKLKVLARSLPQDKDRLIKLSRELNLVVGMTGDGVNDAPALKKANVGFAMGSGTEVAKEVSDIIILDDNFLSIAQAILFGRTIFKSIRKFIIFQLTINFCAISLSIIGPFLGIIEPITIIQMLWINMVMDTLAGLAFAYEPPLIEYMKELPKQKDEPIMNSYMLNQIIVSSVYCSVICLLFLKLPVIYNLFRIDANNSYLMTAFFGLFIFLAIFNSFNARTHRLNILGNILKNKAFLVVIFIVVVVQLILIYFGGEIFRTTGLTLFEFEIMILVSFSIIPVDFIRKIILKKKNKPMGV